VGQDEIIRCFYISLRCCINITVFLTEWANIYGYDEFCQDRRQYIVDLLYWKHYLTMGVGRGQGA